MIVHQLQASLTRAVEAEAKLASARKAFVDAKWALEDAQRDLESRYRELAACEDIFVLGISSINADWRKGEG